jgi:hypothetical protein
MRPIHAERRVTIDCRDVTGDFPSRINSLLPLTSIEHRRTLFVPTQSEWTAYFDNGWQGTDAYSAVSYLCQKLGCRGIRAVSVPDTFTDATGRGRYGATIFEIYGATTEGCSFLNTRRSISAVNDGGRWNFTAEGNALEFEKLEQYKSRKVQDRFTAEMLDQYLSPLGIHMFAAQFYEAPQSAQLVCKEGPTAAGMKTYSLEEARADY